MWQVLGAYVLVQLFTGASDAPNPVDSLTIPAAVIIENFAELLKEESSVLPIDKVLPLLTCWRASDKSATAQRVRRRLD